jgi:hypothetical protein
MRVPPNFKYVVVTIIGIAAIVLGALYLPAIIPGIGKIMTNIMLAGMGLLIVFTFIKPMFTFLYARADGLLEVFTDKQSKGFHVFTYHLNSGGDSGPGTRDIQQYYIIADTGKLFYRKVYSHEMEPMAGRSGWGGYTSFEESVLTSPMLEKSMAKLSRKSGIILTLGEKMKQTGDNHYLFSMDGKNIELKKYSGVVDEGIVITCTSQATGEVLWKQKI